MSRLTDQAYLSAEQYKTPANLNARVDLHRLFCTNPYGWHPWVLDQLAPRPGARVLEVGGGPGWFWRENRERLPAGVRLTFSDYSLGMLREARSGLAGPERPVGMRGLDFVNLDVQAIALPAGAFDLVIANHMLYHAPDLPRAVRELARVLAPGGRLCAATNGDVHLRELYALMRAFEPHYPSLFCETVSYRLENAAEWLAPAFAHVEVRRYPDVLWVTEARPLVDYVLSSSTAAGRIDPDRAPELAAAIQAQIDAAGGFRVTKDAGVVIAWNDEPA